MEGVSNCISGICSAYNRQSWLPKTAPRGLLLGGAVLAIASAAFIYVKHRQIRTWIVQHCPLPLSGLLLPKAGVLPNSPQDVALKVNESLISRESTAADQVSTVTCAGQEIDLVLGHKLLSLLDNQDKKVGLIIDGSWIKRMNGSSAR